MWGGEGGRAQPWVEGEPAENTQHEVKAMAAACPSRRYTAAGWVREQTWAGYLRNLAPVLSFGKARGPIFYSLVEKGIKKKNHPGTQRTSGAPRELWPHDFPPNDPEQPAE